MLTEQIIQDIRMFWEDIKAARKKLSSSQSVLVNSKEERNIYDNLASRWFSGLSKALISYRVNSDAILKYNSAFKSILKLSASANRRESFSKQFDIIAADFNDEVVIFLQTDAEEPEKEDIHELGEEVLKILSKIPNKDENEYLLEALGCWKEGYLKGATVLLWCSAIDRIHKVIEQGSFEVFNNTSTQMKAQTSGRFKRFTKEYSIHSISELRSTVFDNDILWILEGMQLIDANERTRLASCFDMRCHSGHPGDAPITKYNVLSCFSDIVEIILANPKFLLYNTSAN